MSSHRVGEPRRWDETRAPSGEQAASAVSGAGEFARQGKGSEIPRALRPRERLLAKGARALTPRELIGVVLGRGSGEDGAIDVAAKLLRRHALPRLAAMGLGELSAIPGVGQGRAARLCAVFELGRRAYAGDGEERPRVGRPRDAFDQVRGLTRARKEHLVGLYLDAQNGLIGRETISIGSLNTTRTHPREILYPAVTHLALGFILAHNHPSGCLDPSEEDVEFTRSVKRAGEVMGIELYDHLIVASGGYTSLRERGLL